MSQQNEITFLPSFSDVFNSLNSTFTVNIANCISLEITHSLIPEVQGTICAKLQSGGLTLSNPVNRILMGFLRGKIGDYVSFSVGGQTQNGLAVSTAEIQGVVSPFFIVNGRANSDGKNYMAAAQFSARQPYSHINALIDAKNGLISGSAAFGNQHAIVGFDCRFRGMVDKLGYVKVMGYKKHEKSTVATAFAYALDKKKWKGMVWIEWDFLKDLHLGIKAKYDSLKPFSVFCGYTAKIGAVDVKGRFGSDGIVCSELSGKLTPNIMATVSTSLNHKAYEYTLGFHLGCEST